MLGIVTVDIIVVTDVLHHRVNGVVKIISCFGFNIDGQEVEAEDRSAVSV